MQCFLFDPTQGGEATSEQKILFYHPPTTPLADQVGLVGLCEAIAGFSSTFSSEGVETLHTQNGRLVSMKAESSVWIVLSIPHAPAAKSAAVPAAAAAGTEGNSPDELPISEEVLQDSALQALATRLYTTLRLACGPLAAVAAERGVGELRRLLADVMPVLLRLLLPGGDDDGRRLDLLDTLEGARFLPVDRRLYLKVQYVLNLVLLRHPCVRHTMMLYSDQVSPPRRTLFFFRLVVLVALVSLSLVRARLRPRPRRVLTPAPLGLRPRSSCGAR